ncbi:hypothetical protein ACLOAV_008306 [Pseudogymnoascus australis]
MSNAKSASTDAFRALEVKLADAEVQISTGPGTSGWQRVVRDNKRDGFPILVAPGGVDYGLPDDF